MKNGKMLSAVSELFGVGSTEVWRQRKFLTVSSRLSCGSLPVVDPANLRSVFTLSNDSHVDVNLAHSLCGCRAYEFFEPWITSKLIEHWVEPQQCGGQRHPCSHCAVVWYRK